MNSHLYCILLCLVCSIGLSNGIKCYNCDSLDDKDCLDISLDSGNATSLEPVECSVEVVHSGPLSGFQLGVTAHFTETKFANSPDVEFDCMKTEKIVSQTVFKNATSEMTTRNVYVTRTCSIKSSPDACERFKSMTAASKNEFVYCGLCDSDGCNFATPSTKAWPLICVLGVLLVMMQLF